MADRTCKTCSTKFIATHGRQIYCNPGCRQDPHAKVTLICDGCAGPAVKDRRSQRYAGTYCSLLCRDFVRWGQQSCTLPSDHMARCFGQACKWTPPQMIRSTTCEWCGEQFETTRVSQSYCTVRCKYNCKRQRRRARALNAPGEYRYVDVMRQYRAQGYACAYCKEPARGLPDPEHVVPLSRGGRNDMSNLVAACKQCNSDKRDLLLPEWAANRRARGLRPVDTTLEGAAYRALLTPWGRGA